MVKVVLAAAPVGRCGLSMGRHCHVNRKQTAKMQMQSGPYCWLVAPSWALKARATPMQASFPRMPTIRAAGTRHESWPHLLNNACKKRVEIKRRSRKTLVCDFDSKNAKLKWELGKQIQYMILTEVK